MKIFIDTNVLLDYLLDRKPFSAESTEVIKFCKEGSFEGFISEHSLTDILYITRKDFDVDIQREIIKSLCTIFTMVNISSNEIIEAVGNNGFSDLEDSIQSVCAAVCKSDYLITRNTKDFVNSEIRAISPNDFITLLKV